MCVQRVVIPAAYQPANTYYGDIALLLLDASVPFRFPKMLVPHGNSTVPERQRRFVAFGWGFFSPDMMLSPELRYAWLETLPPGQCSARHEASGLGPLPADHFCAGADTSQEDTCKGDSGGPLLLPARSLPGSVPGLSRDYLVGVTSYGPPNSTCGSGDSVGFYTSISFWYTWIQDSLSLYNLRG